MSSNRLEDRNVVICENGNFCVALAKRKPHKSGEMASFVPPARNPPASKSCDDNCLATANRAESCAFQSTKSVFLRVKHEKPESSSQSISQSINDAARWLNDMNECVNE